ncbi:MAG: ABC transporter permease [Candidatus Heimdallarchaeota archaeon]
MTDYLTATSIVIASTFLLIPTLGELISERSGVLNLGVEGMIISSAAGSYLVAFHTREELNLGFYVIRWTDIGLEGKQFLGGEISVWIGILSGLLIGMALASIHGLLTITFSRNQIVSGIAITIFGTGLSGMLGRTVGGKAAEVESLEPYSIPILDKIPFFGEVLFNQNVLVYFSLLMVPMLWFLLFKTKYGILIRTVGENPAAAHNQGVKVNKVRFNSVLFGGAMAGIAGAYLTLAWLPTWSDGMTKGRGWLVIALVIIALWHPFTSFVGAYIFGIFWVYQTSLQSGITVFNQTLIVPTAILNMLPYVSTLLFLMIGSIIYSRSKVKKVLGAPSALTVPFRED